jgi:hypothetical protein
MKPTREQELTALESVQAGIFVSTGLLSAFLEIERRAKALAEATSNKGRVDAPPP